MISYTRIILIALLYIAIIWGCKKIENVVIDVPTPQSSFTTSVVDASTKQKKTATINYIDSAFYFQNTSQTGTDITYKWSFGDGTTSDAKSPSHAYTTSGSYIVRLITTKSSKANDTAQVVLSVIVGQKEITIGTATTSTSAINIVETTDNSFLLLGSAYDTKLYPYNTSYFLMKLDNNLKQKSLKTFPTTTHLNSISACSDGNYILTGTTSGNTNNNELIKLSADGNVLWSKVISSDNFINVQQTEDNGYVLTGSRNVADQYNNQHALTFIVKTDESGNVKWEKFFNKDIVIEQTMNVVAENDGYVVSGIKRKDINKATNCSYCDSLAIIKLNTQGGVLWQKAVEWGLNTNGYGSVNISKMKNGNYNIIGTGVNALFLFSASGNFLDRKLSGNVSNNAFNTTTSDGNIVILEREYGNGFRAKLGGFTEAGLAKWSVGINGQQTLPNGGYSCCADSWPIIVNPLKNTGCIFLSNKIDINDHHYIAVVVKVDANGKVM